MNLFKSFSYFFCFCIVMGGIICLLFWGLVKCKERIVKGELEIRREDIYLMIIKKRERCCINGIILLKYFMLCLIYVRELIYIEMDKIRFLMSLEIS